ncbi:MAG TPA: protein phosphatase 2C domain-containing protein [Kofleriaceae bacterium]
MGLDELDTRPAPAAPAPDAIPPVATSDHGLVAGYRVVAASVVGRGHVYQQRPCDDAFKIVVGCDGSRAWWFAAVADGAGSRALSRHGAEAATSAAAQRAAEALAAGWSLRDAIAAAVSIARTAQADRARQHGAGVADLSCTLLCLACGVDGPRMSLATFQVGDGLIAAIDDHGAIVPLAQADDEVPGATLFLESLDDHGWDARIRCEEPAAPPRGLVVATDGLADDLIPWSENGPILAGELDPMVALPDAGARLGEILSYEKHGSFDDRTLVVAWRCSGPSCG